MARKSKAEAVKEITDQLEADQAAFDAEADQVPSDEIKVVKPQFVVIKLGSGVDMGPFQLIEINMFGVVVHSTLGFRPKDAKSKAREFPTNRFYPWSSVLWADVLPEQFTDEQ